MHTRRNAVRIAGLVALAVLAWLYAASDVTRDLVTADAATLNFAKRVIDSSRGGDVKIAVDIDGDGYRDLVVGGLPGEDLRWYRYPSWTRATIAVPNIEFTTDGEAGDVDGDGDPDIVVPDGYGSNSLVWFANPRVRPGGGGNPADGSQWTRRVIGSIGNWGKDIELSDFDGNGLLDVANRLAAEHSIFFQTSANVWSKQTFVVSHNGNEGLGSGDVDRDGDADLIVEGAWLRNPGGAAARNPSSWTTFSIGGTHGEFKAVVADIDGDAANEILFSSSEGVADIVWWDPVNGNPTGSWTPHVIAPMVDRAHTLQAADMDNDGDTDVVVGQMHTSADKELVVYLNVNGNGGTWSKYLVDRGTGLHNGVVADIGNDGDLDIFGANWAGNAPVALWESLIGSGSDTQAPSIPSSVSATTTSSTAIAVSWAASTDNVGVTTYRVFRNGTAVGTPTTTSYADSGLTPATTYTYRVSALDAAGNESAQSTATSATTAAAADTTPPVLSGVAASGVTSTSATITWTTNELATSRVDYGTTTAYGANVSPSGSRTSHTVTLSSLQPSTTYHYRARSTDASGNQGSSADLTFTTAVVSSGPSDAVAHWRFDEGSGTVAGDAVGGYGGTLSNGAAWTTGRYQTGVSFDGVNDFVSLPAIDVSGQGLTLAVWVKSDSFSTNVDQRFIAKSVDLAEQSHYWMLGQALSGGQNRLRFRLRAGGTTTTLVAASGTLPVNSWYHVAATYDGSAMKLYLNGVEVGSASKAGALATSSAVPVSIGRSPDGSNHMHGAIDDMWIYRRALTASEIVTLSQGPTDTAPPSTPTNVSATATSSAAITVAWTASTDNVAVTSYRVFRNGSAVGTPTTTSYTDSGLTPSTTYTYRVSALDAAGNESSQSAPASATTAPPADTTAPVLSAVTASNVTSGTATISWTTNEAAGSRVDYGTTITYGANMTQSGLRTSHSLTLTNLQPSTTYHYRAASSDAAGNQGISGDLMFTTQTVQGPPPADAIAEWLLDEGFGGTAADGAGAHHGTLMNGAAWATGHHGSGVSFDGQDDFIALPNLNVAGTAITLATWVKSSSFAANSDQRFIAKSTDMAEQSHYWMLSQTQVNGQNRLRFRLKAGGATTTLVAASGTLPLNGWYHVAATYDGSAMRLYLNGVEVGSVAKTGALSTSTSVPVNIGRSPDGSNYMHGVIDDVRVYSRALLPSEIEALMSAQ